MEFPGLKAVEAVTVKAVPLAGGFNVRTRLFESSNNRPPALMVTLTTAELTFKVMVCPFRIVTVSVERGTVFTQPAPAQVPGVPQLPETTLD